MKELLERLDGDEGFLCELPVIFREDTRLNLEKSREAMAKRDFEMLARAAHTLKGMLRNLSMNAAGETAAALETASRENADMALYAAKAAGRNCVRVARPSGIGTPADEQPKETQVVSS